MIFSDNYNSTIRVFSFAVVLLISFTAIACEDIIGSDEEKVLANYTDQYTFNFSTDSVSIIIEQGFEELGRGANPEITTVDTSLETRQAILEFEVNPVDIFADNPDPNVEFQFAEEELYVWYSAEERQADLQNKSQRDGTISTPPAVPAYIITRIFVKKNAQMNVDINYLKQ